jgi:structural maintenance of chromosome 2
MLRQGTRFPTPLVPVTKVNVGHKSITAAAIASARRDVPNACVAADYLDLSRAEQRMEEFAEPRVAAVLRDTFMRHVVVQNVEETKTIAFGRAQLIAVDFAGEYSDPSGVMAQGVDTRAPTLSKFIKYDKLTEKIQAAETVLVELEKKLASRPVFDRLIACDARLAASKDEIRLAGGAEEERVGELEAQCAEQEKQLKEKQDALDVANKSVQALKEAWGESDANQRENLLDERVKDARKRLSRGEAAMRRAELAVSRHRGEMADLQLQLQDLRERKEENRTQIEAMRAQIVDIGREREELEARKKVASAELAVVTEELAGLDPTARVAEREAKVDVVDRAKQKIDILKETLAALDRIEKREEERRADLRATNPWVETEERLFGVSGTDFAKERFASREAAHKAYRRAMDDLEDVEPGINKDAPAMCARADVQYAEIDKRRKGIDRDLPAIETGMKSLSKAAERELGVAYTQVGKDFTAILTQVLPNMTGLLRPLDRRDLRKGLQIVVRFNGAEKSLGELSGGQRSLVAMSLVLSLLKFRPAPLYILDEMDAELDVAHTENIGEMLKATFRTAQFMIVSLNEGMWQAADTLFRVSFDSDANSSVVKRLH